jgi:hypothetical protein
MKILLTPIILIQLLFQLAFSQKTLPPTLWRTFLSVGYANAAPSDVRNYYHSILDFYQSNGVPIFAQTDFGRSLLVNTGILFSKLENIRAGISIGYIYSPAYANYKDYAGTFKVNGSVSSYELSLKMQATLDKLWDFPIIVGIRPGLNYSTATVTETLRFFDFPQNNYDSKTYVYNWGPCFEVTFGTSVQIGPIIGSFESGYRITYVKIIKVPIKSNFGEFTHIVEWNIGQTGFVFLFSVGINL